MAAFDFSGLKLRKFFPATLSSQNLMSSALGMPTLSQNSRKDGAPSLETASANSLKEAGPPAIGEDLVLRLAGAYERATAWHKRAVPGVGA